MKLEAFKGPQSTRVRRQFWATLYHAVLASRKMPGRHISVDEHTGKGTVINIADSATRRGGAGIRPTVKCPTHLSIEACLQYGGETCWVNVSETVETDIDMECPLDLGTSGCKAFPSDVPLTSHAFVGDCNGGFADISGAYFHFYSCINWDVGTGWSFTPSIVFPNWPLTLLASGVNLGLVDLINDGPFSSDPSDGPCPCSGGPGSILCSNYIFTFS